MPQAGVAHSRLAQANLAAQNWEGAAKEFKAALELGVDSVDIHVELGFAYEKQQQTAEALREYKTALDMSPLDFRANLFAGRMLGMHGSAEQALPYLQRAETADPNSQDAHRFLAKVYTQLGREEEAEREQQQADRLKTEKK
jgi:Tfp pilus assembly protein PilF